ncbi:hypothetical protein K491DRAFT_729174 [Lophiostoma macrostomum CBS 122681]|uniref:Prolyl 4-hydroxylase alpha subunit Fe(2+) 2OG dioxygenase domain-containing protein n=1 Tax=Lophiostoma macrostomum CBS 122681 TaxID=1314788 RepID=A0A6A6SV52_9PLEO|nr:hypothetical protein K491DRAFT_729174 [Lophiostoma macrostomum CBS 122681]
MSTLHQGFQYPDGDESDVSDVGDEEFRIRLQECLDDVETAGSFSSFRHNSAYSNPGLQVNGIGLVGMPLTHRDAEAFARICKQSPYGKGEETLIDTSVRKTWELGSADFECANPSWTRTFDHILSDALTDLGVGVPARAEQYKLLLYEEGAFFKPHRDSEKTPGMFGTLVICLPSEHSGGEVHLIHGKEQRILQTETNSAFDLSALAWYSDVQHEVRRVTYGFRLVLTYNLVQDNTVPRQSAAALDESHARLE